MARRVHERIFGGVHSHDKWYTGFMSEYLDRFILVIHGEKGFWNGISYVGEVGTGFE